MLCNFTRLAALVFSFFAANVKAKNQSKSKSFPILIKISLIYFAFFWLNFPIFSPNFHTWHYLIFHFSRTRNLHQNSQVLNLVVLLEIFGKRNNLLFVITGSQGALPNQQVRFFVGIFKTYFFTRQKQCVWTRYIAGQIFVVYFQMD